MNSIHELLLLSALALYLGDAFTEFFKNLNKDFIVPLLRPFSDPIKEAHDFTVHIFGMEFALGKVFVSLIHLLFALLMALISIRLLDKYASGWIKRIYK